jgi:hypothetical protein
MMYTPRVLFCRLWSTGQHEASINFSWSKRMKGFLSHFDLIIHAARGRMDASRMP